MTTPTPPPAFAAMCTVGAEVSEHGAPKLFRHMTDDTLTRLWNVFRAIPVVAPVIRWNGPAPEGEALAALVMPDGIRELAYYTPGNEESKERARRWLTFLYDHPEPPAEE